MQKTICSIFFQPLKANRPYRRRDRPSGFNSSFEIPAANPGEYHLLVVDDVDEVQRNGSQQIFQTPVFGDHLADDLVGEWRSNKIANEYGRPGIFVCEGTEPSEAELARERFIQETWCLKLVGEAEAHWSRQDRHLVSELHRAAAKYLGQEGFEWVHRNGQIKLIECKFCSTKINASAMICKECGNVLDLERWLKAQQAQIEAEQKLEELRKKLGVVAAPPPPPTPQATAAPSEVPPKLNAPLQPNAPKQPART